MRVSSVECVGRIVLSGLAAVLFIGCSSDDKDQVKDPANRLPEDKIFCVCSDCFFCNSDTPNDAHCPAARVVPINMDKPISGNDCVTANSCIFDEKQVKDACLAGCVLQSKIIASCTVTVENSEKPGQTCDPLGCGGGAGKRSQSLGSSAFAVQSLADGKAALQPSSRIDLTFGDHTGGSQASGTLSVSLCSHPPCEITVNRASVTAAPITFEDCVLFFCESATIFDLASLNSDSMTALLQADGSFQVDPDTAHFFSTFNVDGDAPGSTELAPVAPPTGRLDLAAGTISLTGRWRGLPGSGYTDLQVHASLSGSFVTAPLIVDAGTAQTIECSGQQRGLATLGGAGSVGAGQFFWHDATALIKLGEGSDIQASLALGSHEIELRALGVAGGAGLATVTVDVVDTTPPAFAPLLTRTALSLCQPAVEPAQLLVPAAADTCFGIVAVTGQIVESNGVAVGKPVVNGQVALDPGVHRVRWSATDGAGNTATIEQIIDVRPSIWADGVLDVRDRARALAPAGFALVGNRGSSLSRVGVEAKVGDLLSVASVDLRDRAEVHGHVTSAGTVQRGNSVVIASPPIVAGGTVSLPPAPVVPVAFPAPAGDVTVGNGATRILGPGSYGNLTVFSRGVLVLSPGVYYFASVDIEPQAIVQVPGQAMSTLHIRQGLILRGQFLEAANTLGKVIVNYSGTAPVVLEADFYGAFVAPAASVALGTGNATNFTGEFFASQLEVRPDAVLRCGSLLPPRVF